MRKAHFGLVTSIVVAAACVPLLSLRDGGGAGLRPVAAEAQAPHVSVPKAVCGPNDRPESGLQGQTTLAERFGGATELGFQCNLELVGAFEGEGTSYGFAWYDDCAYVSTQNSPAQQRLGTVAVDASDPTSPRATAYLDSRAMLEPWESLKVNKKRRLLGGTKGLGRSPDDKYFAFYDISDCANPKLLADIEVKDHIGHAGDFSPDGMTYWGTATLAPGLTALDISDPRNPKLLLHTLDYTVHDLTFSADGTRAYIAQIGGPTSRPNGLVIVDVSDIQYRRPNPKLRTISTLFWNDGATAQTTLPVTFKGRPHLIFTDEHGSGGSGVGGKAAACAQGLPPNGFARIIDITDERHPRTVSKLMLEIGDPANCAAVLANPPDIISSSSHYCNVDDTNNPRILACSYREAGLRVFDIRDPRNPKEIAYYKPRARRNEVRHGSVWYGPLYGRGGDRTTDQTPSSVRFMKRTGENGKPTLELWFNSNDNGFQIVRFTNGLGATRCFDPGPRGCAAADKD